MEMKIHFSSCVKGTTSFVIVAMLQRVCLCAQEESVFSAAPREGALFTEQLIQASSENLLHLMSGLHSVQMLKEVHFKQYSLHFLHIFASVGESNNTHGIQIRAHNQSYSHSPQLQLHQLIIPSSESLKGVAQVSALSCGV